MTTEKASRTQRGAGRPESGKKPAGSAVGSAHASAGTSTGALSFFKSWLRLVRVEHALMSAAGVGAALLIAAQSGGLPLQCACPIGGVVECVCRQPQLEVPLVLLALAVPFFINLASFALNDYFDIEADKKNGRKERPLVSGALSPGVAVWTAVLGYGLGVLAGWLINPMAGLVATVFAALSMAYNAKLKDWPLAGNAYIALSMAIAFPFGAWALAGANGAAMAGADAAARAVAGTWGTGALAAFPPLPAPIFWLAAGAFFAGLARELVKSVQDMKGDQKARNSKHLPILIGAKPCLLLAAGLAVLYAACIVKLAQRPFWNSPLVDAGLYLSAILYLVLALLLLRRLNPRTLERFRKWSLGALGLALLALLVGVLA